MEQTNQLPNIKPTRKNRTHKLWKMIKPYLKIFIIWFLFALPLNFITTISLYYQINGEISYMTMVTILILIVINMIFNALIYWGIMFFNHKLKLNNLSLKKDDKKSY